MAGPSPNPYAPASRHRRSRDLLTLPATSGRAIPDLPEGRAWSSSEEELWRSLWASPQASQWHLSYVASVAQYVVHACAVIGNDASAWMAQEARHLADRLGLTPQGLTALGWRLEDAAAAPHPSSSPAVGSLARARARAQQKDSA